MWNTYTEKKKLSLEIKDCIITFLYVNVECQINCKCLSYHMVKSFQLNIVKQSVKPKSTTTWLYVWVVRTYSLDKLNLKSSAYLKILVDSLSKPLDKLANYVNIKNESFHFTRFRNFSRAKDCVPQMPFWFRWSSLPKMANTMTVLADS